MGRSKAFDEQQVLETVMALFWEKGYGATSIQDLETATGLKRTSLYNAFGDKRSLFQKSLALYVDGVKKMLGTIIEQGRTSREIVRNWLAAVLDFSFDKSTPAGCLVILSVLESKQHDETTREMASALFGVEQELIAKVLEDGVQKGELPKGLDSEQVATAIAATASGIVVLATAGFTEEMLSKLVESTLILLDG